MIKHVWFINCFLFEKKKTEFLLLLLLLVNKLYMVRVGAGSIDRMFDTLSRCGKRVEYATRKAEAIADDVWHHRESSQQYCSFSFNCNSNLLQWCLCETDELLVYRIHIVTFNLIWKTNS